MVTNSITAADRERYTRARTLGERDADNPSALTAARYVQRRDAIELEFAGGGIMTIPRQAISEVAHAPIPTLNAITISPAGDAISWRALDVDIYVPGLVERVFGSRMFAASSGGRGGRRTSKAKAAAARANGAKGGRPRKQLTA
ncbi:MAG TPA: DUF2442 domain-containing protein [Vicinamibacterales bacterium]|nr:DUF2442 domain-containing protein [Vicinamibacterales bacterium]